MLFLILFSGLLYLSYQKNLAVTSATFRTYWHNEKKRSTPQSSVIGSLLNKVIPTRVPDFEIHDYKVATIVILRDSRDVYLGWLGLWFPIQAASTAKESRSSDSDNLDALAQGAMALANASKRAGNHQQAALHFCHAASLYSELASDDSGAALDAIRAYEQGSSAYAHASVNDQNSSISSLESAKEILAKSSSTSFDTHRNRILEKLADAYIKSDNPSMALPVIEQCDWKSSVSLQVQRAKAFVQLDKLTEARIAFRGLAQHVKDVSAYQFRLGEYILDMILCGLAARSYSHIRHGIKDGDEVSEMAWSASRERSFLQSLSDILGESKPKEPNDDVILLAKHLDSWHAMLKGWRYDVIQSWLMSEHPSLVPSLGVSSATSYTKVNRR